MHYLHHSSRLFLNILTIYIKLAANQMYEKVIFFYFHLNAQMRNVHSRSYSFLFTLIIGIFDLLHIHTYHKCACKTMNSFSTTASSFVTKKAFQNHAQAALDIAVVGQSAELCPASA